LYLPTDVVGEVAASGDPTQYAVVRSGLSQLNGSAEKLEVKNFIVSAIKNQQFKKITAAAIYIHQSKLFENVNRASEIAISNSAQ
jgi:hypothetical protein